MMDINAGNTRNLTGLYLSGFIQEGYLPPQERKSTIPSTLYRGHVVKLARRPNSNPHRNSVGKYPMHSLNSGFSGSLLPTKDQKNFRSPERHQNSSHKIHGKWTNYPMSVELRKLAGAGTPGRFLADYIYHKSQQHDDLYDDQHFDNLGRFSSSASVYQDKDEERFYQSMYDEIEKVVSKQSSCMATNQYRLQKILLNNSANAILPNVLTSFPEVKRARTSHSCFGGKSPRVKRETLSNRPNTSAPPLNDSTNTPLLLPLPYVSRYDLLSRQPGHQNSNASPKQFNVSPSPFKSKLEGLLIQPKTFSGISNSSRQCYPMNMKANIGMTSAERLRWFLSPSIQQSIPTPIDPSSARETITAPA